MLVEPKLNIFRQLISDASSDELVWMNGFLSGVISLQSENNTATSSVAESPAVAAAKLSIIYATETGNAKALATRFAAEGKKAGLKIKLAPAETYKTRNLEKEENLVVVISTQGDGEPPLSATNFFSAIHESDLHLPELKFGVLALGDSSYPLFCQAGIDVDNQLELRGGERILPVQKCDTDYGSDAASWFQTLFNYLKDNGQASPQIIKEKKNSGKKLYNGTIITNINLNDEGSEKQTHHLEISAEDLVYEPGDAIGIVPQNNPGSVDEILAITSQNGGEQLVWRDQEFSLNELLNNHVHITYLPERVVKKYADITGQDIPATRMDLIDLLRIYPVKDSDEFFRVVTILEPITPRLYSIASSKEATEEEVHITVALDKFQVNDRNLTGHCSSWLNNLSVDTALNFYVHSNKLFRLPADDEDIIMIGPGTGIAPFRSFLFHRDAQGATGKSWLFFGDQHFTTDFLYQTEIQTFSETGVLTKFNGAFSRDQDHKIYVQHKMLQHAAELYEWIENGAHLYLCGAREPMSNDVEDALIKIIASGKKIEEEDAKACLEKMSVEGKYHKDVY